MSPIKVKPKAKFINRIKFTIVEDLSWNNGSWFHLSKLPFYKFPDGITDVSVLMSPMELTLRFWM
jgi:hypothetical protein